MKKKVIIMGVAAALVLCAIVGGTVAAPTIKSNEGKTIIEIEDVNVALTGSIDVQPDEDNMRVIPLNDLVPGAVIECNYNIRNDGRHADESGIQDYSLYTRVVIDKKWMNDGEEKTVNSLLKPEYIHVQTFDDEDVSSNNMGSDWFVEADTEQIVMYYLKPLKVGEETTPFIKHIVLDSKMNNDYADSYAEITVTVSAVQAEQDSKGQLAKKAMLSEWGVYPEIDDNGVITEIKR